MSVSSELAYWTKVVDGSLPDLGSKKCEGGDDGKIVFLFAPRKARYAKFVATSYHGYAAALQYFDITGPPIHKEC